MKVCIYTSIGDNIDKFITYYQQFRLLGIDLYLNFYGDSDIAHNTISCYSKWHSRIKTSKFPSLKNCYLNSDISQYDYVYVFDDDFIIKDFNNTLGYISNIPHMMSNHNIDVASPSHSTDGRISHDIMKPHPGNYSLRITNFVEMSYVIFSKSALSKYMFHYDGELKGWGNDWWYLNVLECNTLQNCAIFDNICFINPHPNKKPSGQINNLISFSDRKREWECTKQAHKLQEWSVENIKFI